MASAKRVLMVEDDQSLINLFRDYLSKTTNYELYVALTGEEGLKIIESKRPDAVLLDMQLPGIKGTQILKIIREKYPTTKVLVITSFDTEVKDITAKLGVDGFFPKPPLLNEVSKRLKEVLETKRGQNTTVVPVALADIQKRDDVIPKAKILFVEREFWMPWLLPIAEDADTDYGDYEYEVCYDQREAMRALVGLRPDIVICATDVPLEERLGSPSVSTADLIVKMTKSRYAPKGIIVHGTQHDINSFGMQEMVDDSTAWVSDLDPYEPEDTSEKAKENAIRLNRMLWKICYEHNLVKKVK